MRERAKESLLFIKIIIINLLKYQSAVSSWCLIKPVNDYGKNVDAFKHLIKIKPIQFQSNTNDDKGFERIDLSSKIIDYSSSLHKTPFFKVIDELNS